VQEGEPFDYDAVPGRFYFEVETAGNLTPDDIVQQGIKVLQTKLASVLIGLTEGDSKGNSNGMNGNGYEPQSPDAGMNGAGWNDAGYTTPYADQNGGQGSAWGGQGGATPYGATPYGGGGNGWN
jgi:DNA-directed RNA polymerase II subunit RPB3